MTQAGDEEADLRRWLVSYLVTNVGCDPNEVDVDIPFNELGVGSRDGVVLAGELAELLGRAVSPIDIWQTPTIAGLAHALTHPDSEAALTAEGSLAALTEPIAIIGLGCRMPGDINGPDELWDFNEDGSVVVVFNGEIYNYQELIPELQAAGHRFHTKSDTEVIVHAWEQWGEACVERFRGMFAFVLWDRNRQTLFMARDRLGVKPLYYAVLDDGTLLFGSELKSLLAHGGLRREAVEEGPVGGDTREDRVHAVFLRHVDGVALLVLTDAQHGVELGPQAGLLVGVAQGGVFELLAHGHRLDRRQFLLAEESRQQPVEGALALAARRPVGARHVRPRRR